MYNNKNPMKTSGVKNEKETKAQGASAELLSATDSGLFSHSAVWGSWGICKTHTIMRKILLSLAGLLTFGGMMAQPVSDNAVIPVSVTLNSILRLNVTTGGNIEFNVNTLAQYASGIANTAGTTTTFTVASSLDFDVILFAEDTELIGTDLSSSANTMDLDNVGYTLTYGGPALGVGDYTFVPDIGDLPEALTSASATIISSGSGVGAGDINKNKFAVHWEMGTMRGTMNGGTLLSQNIPADRYSTNVFIMLVAQ
jgi:hypothetical protein